MRSRSLLVGCGVPNLGIWSAALPDSIRQVCSRSRRGRHSLHPNRIACEFLPGKISSTRGLGFSTTKATELQRTDKIFYWFIKRSGTVL